MKKTADGGGVANGESVVKIECEGHWILRKNWFREGRHVAGIFPFSDYLG